MTHNGPSTPGPGLRGDVMRLRTVFTLVPWRMRGRIILLLLASLLTSLLDMVAVATMLPLTQMLTAEGRIPPVVQQFVVPVLGTDDRQSVLIALALLVGLGFLVKNLSMIIIRWWSLGETNRAAAAVQSELLRRYQRTSYTSHRSRSKATVLQTISNAVRTAFTNVLLGYITVVVDGLTIVMLMVLLVVMSPLASLAAAVLFIGASLLMIRVLKPAAVRYALRALGLDTDAWGYLNPAIEGFREARIFRRERLFADAYEGNRSEHAKIVRNQALLAELPKYLLEIVMILGILVVAMLLFATQPEATAFGLLAVFAAAALRVVPALNRVVATINGVRAGGASLELVAAQIVELQRDRQEVEQDVARIEIPATDIVVRDLGFKYPDGEEDVLSGVDTVIPWGRTVALVGSSGAGKTTFADILAGLLQPTTGEVTVGGVDISEYPRSWAADVAMVSQRVYLWDATVRDLITFGLPKDNVDEDLLEDVVRRARLTEMVDNLPQGLDSVVGDSGGRLSGGQAQRIGIARALYSRPKYLILDEATSSLDNETEHEVTATIEALRGEITVVVIAHRLSTVKNADEILYFAKGRLRDRGTMAELRSRDVEFARLVDLGSVD
jgi:ABC-type multidrug transport system fused ATPase/permease subunit